MERADGILYEAPELEQSDPYESAAKVPFPYEHGRLSKIYQNYPPEKRKKVNQETDEQFRRVTLFTGKLDPSNPKHNELIWKWFRIRDMVMVLKYREKDTTKKAFKIEAKIYNVGPSEVEHQWKNIARISTSVELEVTSATITNTEKAHEAVSNISKEEALSKFDMKIKEEFSSPKMELYNSTDPWVKSLFRLRFIHYLMIVSDIREEQLTKQFIPLLDFTKQSKLNFLWEFKEDKQYAFPEWQMSQAKAVLRTQMYVDPI